jgi:hypothetical protein
MEKHAILSTALLPNLDYMKLLMEADSVLIEAWETYAKQSYRNRYTILGPNGVQSLSLPVKKKQSGSCPIHLVDVSYDEYWPRVHWRALVSAYNSAPFFLYYQDEFEELFMRKHTSLLDFNATMLNLLCSSLGIKVKWEFTKVYKKHYDDKSDYRDLIHPKKDNLYDYYPSYYQVFHAKFPFQANLSALDLLFNMGPESIGVLQTIK